MDMSSLGKFAAFVGIDWADRKHDVCLLPAGSDTPYDEATYLNALKRHGSPLLN